MVLGLVAGNSHQLHESRCSQRLPNLGHQRGIRQPRRRIQRLGCGSPGTRQSTYANPKYIEAAPFAETVLDSILAADPSDATADPVPYTGIQYVAIPEFAGLGTQVGANFSEALAGTKTAEEALSQSQSLLVEEMEAAGYN